MNGFANPATEACHATGRFDDRVAGGVLYGDCTRDARSSLGRMGPARMTDRTVDLDLHRGMAAQKATEIRRVLAEVEADERALRLRQDALEAQLGAAPAATWTAAAVKARYLLNLFAATPAAQDPRRQTLIANVLDDLQRLTRADEEGAPS